MFYNIILYLKKYDHDQKVDSKGQGVGDVAQQSIL